jgi:anti-sigma factor RsiW
MFCDEVLDAIEPIAAGELTPDGRIAAHLDTCPNCAAALAGARRVEQLLQARTVPKPPPQFTARTMAVVRRRRWRSEQFVDAGFNVALAIIGFGVVVAAWTLLQHSGLVPSTSFDALGFGFGLVRQRVPPSFPVYAGATVLFAMALGLWWWAERDTHIW